MFTKCPHCGKPAVSIARKISQRFYEAYTCDKCGVVIGLPWWICVAYLLIICLAIAVYNLLKGMINSLVIAILAIVILGITQLAVPFVEKEQSSLIMKNK